MERLESFVARSLLQRLAPLEHDNGLPASADFRGAVLFADISGYTALAEAMCSFGSDGVERLGRLLDDSFGRYVQAITERGGEIASFAGDALIAYWAADDGDMIGAVSRALAAANGLHAASRVESSGSSDVGTTLHIGLGAGDIWGTLLTSGPHEAVLLAGPAVRQACTAAGRARAGTTEVAADIDILPVDERAVDRLSTDGSGRQLTPSVTVDVSRHVAERVRKFYREGYPSWIPQRLPICALFVRIDGIDESSREAVGRYQEVFNSLQTALRPFTTATGALLVDDKGLVFTLALGMPHDTHADDAMRAVRAGLAIQAEVSRMGLTCAIGVADGEGVCKPLGGGMRSHYWSVGRFMHMAGRLMEAARTGLLCTETIAERARRVVSISPERPLFLKGIARPVPVYRVRDAHALTERVERLHGREDELAILEQCVTAFEEGRGTVVSIVGDAGIGKTALIGDLRRRLERRKVTCLSGAAGAIHSGAYAAWRPVFESLLAPAIAGTSDERRASLGDLRHPHLAALVNAVVPGFLEESHAVRGLSGQARADATATVLEEVLQHHVTNRFALVLEDCHWVDSASWRLVLRLAQNFPQALIVVTSRPDSSFAEAHNLQSFAQFIEIRLGPLRPDAIRQVIASVLDGHATTTDVVNEIAARAVGNPLFAVEYALLMSARGGHPEPARRTWGDAPAGDAAPVTVQRLIATRLDALSPAEDLALKAACVLGDAFTVELLKRVFPEPIAEQTLIDVLAALVEKQLLTRSGRADADCAFHHTVVREVCYQQLTDDQRRELHRRAAEAIKSVFADDLQPHFATLAHHSLHAELPEPTLHYSALASSQALAAGAFEEAERLLTTCLRFDRQSHAGVTATTRIRWLRQIADARHGVGRLEPRAAAAHEALRLAGIRRPHSTATLVAQAAARFCRWKLSISPSMQVEWDVETVLDVARALRHSAEVCYFKDDMVGMACDSFGAITYARCVPPSTVLVGASAELGGLLAIAGFRAIGERMLQDAIDLAASEGDNAAQAHGHMIRCLYYVGQGEWESAARSADDCQKQCEPIDDRVTWTNAQAVRFWMYHHTCQHAAALDAASRLHTRAVETGNRQHRAWGLRCLAVCQLERDNQDEAVRHLREALQYLDETSARNERFPTLGLLALAQLRAGDEWAAGATARAPINELKKDFDSWIAILRWLKRPISHATLEGYSALFTVALESWQKHGIMDQSDVKTCLNVLRRLGRAFRIAKPRFYLHEGDVHRVRGATAAARRSYSRGREHILAMSRRPGEHNIAMPREFARCEEALTRLEG